MDLNRYTDKEILDYIERLSSRSGVSNVHYTFGFDTCTVYCTIDNLRVENKVIFTRCIVPQIHENLQKEYVGIVQELCSLAGVHATDANHVKITLDRKQAIENFFDAHGLDLFISLKSSNTALTREPELRVEGEPTGKWDPLLYIPNPGKK